MRITHQMLNRNYINRMHTNLKSLTRSNQRLASQRAFNKGYENVPDAGRALQLRKLVFNNERYQTTIRDAQGRAAAAEDGIRTINSLMSIASDKMVEALNGHLSESDRDKIATELEKLQEEMFQVMNSKFSGNYLYGAAGNSDGSAPFTLENGVLHYNGTEVDSITRDPATGQLVDGSGQPVPYNTDNYVDIGFGYTLQADGTVDPNTAFKDTYSGLSCFGFGVQDGVPVNAYNLFGSMVENLRNNDVDAMAKDLDAIPTTMDFLLTSVTEVGARGVTLENTMASLEGEYEILAEMQNKIEGIDLGEEAMINKMSEMSWLVTLQLSSRILPTTLFDFLR